MTDSMKFGPEWLRNMSAEPSVVGSLNNINNVAAGGGLNSAPSLHSLGGGGGGGMGSGGGSNLLASQSHATISRNLFPEYRYGREEMLSLFDRNCLLPQILPSFKKLFVEKVQYPLALTPSSEDEMNTQNPIGSNSRPAWLQRSAGGFGISSRGSPRGGVVDRGRMRGKSAYHPIYQRPSALYDDSLSATPIKPERNWSERNGIGDSTAVGVPTGCSGVAGGGIDWNGTPGSSPRKEYSNHNRNMENWRRNRNEDGSGDGPTSGNLTGLEGAGWRSGSGASTQRWGRSTSWRDDEPLPSGNLDGSNFCGNTTTGVQRSISVIGTVSTERANAKTLPGPAITAGTNRQVSSKWTGSNMKRNADGEDNLPEWAMENPSEMGGTFDSSGAFHGESVESEHYGQKKSSITNSRNQADRPVEKEYDSFVTKDQLLVLSSTNNSNIPSQNQSTNSDPNVFVDPMSSDKEPKTTEITITSKERKTASTISPELTPTHKSAIVHGEISERHFKEVANEVEKLIMDDDGDDDCAKILVQDGISSEPVATITSRYVLPGQLNAVVNVEQQQQQQQQQQNQPHLINQPTLETAAKAMLEEFSHKPMPFTLQQHQQHHQHLQQQQQQHLSVLPSHMINANANDLWFYRDPQSNVQGPFSAIEMTEWYRAGYFNENLFVRRFSDSRFRPLGELIKLCHGNMPFTHSHLLPTPMDLDNLQINLTARKPSAINLPFSLGEQQQLRPGVAVDEQLKASVTAVADSLNDAVKGHISAHTMDTSRMLTMRFQLLQDQYLQHQEYQILSELSKNECFQRLDAAQREAIVRNKVQVLVLPEYLSSFSGLSNSLTALNPIAGSQLNDSIAQQVKKDQQQQQQHIFSGSVDPRPTGIFLDATNFIINAQLMHQQQQTQEQCPPPEQVLQIGSDQETNKLNELPTQDINVLNEYNLRMLLRGSATTNSQLHQQNSLLKPNSGVDFMTESQLLTTQMMPIWPQNLQQQHVSQPWPAMPNAKVTLWDVATLEEEQNQQLLHQKQQQKRHLAALENTNSTIHLDIDGGSQQENDEHRKSDTELAVNIGQDGQLAQQTLVKNQSLNLEAIEQRKDQQPAPNQSSFKQANKQQQQPVHKQQQGNSKQSELKINEEDRRREQAEEKKRVKEERKRQQQEDEKRRAMIAEEEKNRQQQEEKERQQQIQAQRRKALLGNQQATATPNATSTYSTGSETKPCEVKLEQQTARSHAPSIAPWSLQSPSGNTVAPGLAEIQKAERRERRADQQRQQEQLDKQMRANAAAAAEANDALLKWQAAPAPAPVMNLVDIQAEEAKRLASELVEQQRRREHEQQQQATVAASLNVSSNIWGNSNKAWSGSVTNTSSVVANSGLWDEQASAPTASKYLTLGTTTAASVLAIGGQQSAQKQQSHLQVKSSAILPLPRNLRKSQTLPAMQNVVLSKTGKTATVNSQLQQQHDKTKVVHNKTSSKATFGSEDKKPGVKTQHQSSDASSHNKISEYENEFTGWCIKSLDNMSAKVDVPTFVAFLQDLEAPYEVKDYVRIYLGEGKDSSDFVKQFLERRSKYKSLQRAQNAHNDDMCKPAPAITPSSNDNGENKNKQKKIKKNKMTKMDAGILGFSVTAAEGRINVGSRDYVDGP